MMPKEGTLKMIELKEEHILFLSNIGYTIEEIEKMNNKDRNSFIANILVPYICGDGTKKEEDLADDILTFITR